jgi:hypothetical protein
VNAPFSNIKIIANELEDNPEMANDIIKFLNCRTKEEMREFNFNDRKITIMDSKRVLTKKRMLQNDENKFHRLVGEIGSF